MAFWLALPFLRLSHLSTRSSLLGAVFSPISRLLSVTQMISVLLLGPTFVYAVHVANFIWKGRDLFSTVSDTHNKL